MAQSLFFRYAILAIALCSTVSAKYKLVHHYSPKNFFDGFDFYDLPDPTQGFVEYVNRSYAQANGLISTHKDQVRIGVDHKNIYPINAVGRPSVRLQSTATYTQGLFILSLNHMPYGCGSWPAFWTLGPNWPFNGEIDIIEGVNKNNYNVATLHTGPDCTIAGTHETGTLLTNNCTSSPAQNIGCGVQDLRPQSYGAGFNKAGGGVYIMEWTSNSIRTWFFSHKNVPASITKGSPNPNSFGKPMAHFKGSCDIDSSFSSHQLVFDVTFCGVYAGNTYAYSTCPNASGGYAACVAHVAAHPKSFSNTYWSINYLKAFQEDDSSKMKAQMKNADEPDDESLHSKQPVAATSKQLLQSLRYAGMGAPASVTKTLKANHIRTDIVKRVVPAATEVPSSA